MSKLEEIKVTTPTNEVYSELQQAYEHFNMALFNHQLPYCLITMQREKRTFGYFSHRRFVNEKGTHVDELAMNPSYFGVRSIKETLSTLCHEQVHVWQYYFGKPGRRGYHNKQWANYMEMIGLMPSDTGAKGGNRTGESMSHYIVPNGAFDRSCDILLSHDFQLSWYDRFPPIAPILQPPVESGQPGSCANPEEIGTLSGTPVSKVSPLIDASLLEFTGGENKSNRTKYRCDICASQVWGKPGLIILCGHHGCDSNPFSIAFP